MRKAIFFILCLVLIYQASAAMIVVRPGYAVPGDTEFVVKIRSAEKLKDVSASMYMPDIDLRESSGSFDVKRAESIRMMAELPDEPGLYPVRVTVTGDDFRKVKWTWLIIE